MRFDAVSKRFAGVTAVDGVSLDIYQGEFFALLGPSGCGKTTLLRMLAGFETPDAGRVLLDGEDLTGVPPHRRPVNMMFQSYALFPHLTVAGNVAFGLKQDGLPKDEIAARIAEMLALLRLEGLETRKPHQLSGGQRQRVALARALVKRPRVLLLDEPLAALDKKLRGETQFELMRLKERLGLTFVIVTHDQEEAMTVADRIGVMNQGRLIQVATPSGNLRAAEFALGRRLHRRREPDRRPRRRSRRSRNDASRARRSARCARQRRPKQRSATPSAVALRPEKIRIGRDAPPARANRVEGEVCGDRLSRRLLDLQGAARRRLRDEGRRRQRDAPGRAADRDRRSRLAVVGQPTPAWC